MFQLIYATAEAAVKAASGLNMPKGSLRILPYKAQAADAPVFFIAVNDGAPVEVYAKVASLYGRKAADIFNGMLGILAGREVRPKPESKGAKARQSVTV